jgi:hypothetical protein
MRRVASRLWGFLAMLAGAAVLLAAVLLWAPHSVRGWLSGVLAAVTAGVGTDLVLKSTRELRPAKSPEPGFRPGTDVAGHPAPIAVTVSLHDVSFVEVSDAHGSTVEVPASGHGVRLTVEAVDTRAVILSRLCPVVLSRRPPAGDLIPHAGAVPVRRFTVSLDEDSPVLEPQDAAGDGFPLKVTADDPEVIELRVQTERWDVTWVLELDWIWAGHEGTTRIDLGGHPFRCVARPAGPSYAW